MPAVEEEPDPNADRSPDDDRDADDRETDESEADESDSLADLRASAEVETSRWQRGRSVSFLGASLPVRVLAALGIFIVAFMIVWMALWGLLGGIGLALGWLPAAVLGVLALKLIGQSVWA